MPEIKKQIPLLKSDGTLTEEGWARSPLWTYNRESIAASALRIKEWDYYSILSLLKILELQSLHLIWVMSYNFV